MQGRRATIWALAVLGLVGAGWGLNQPLAKIAVSEGYRASGLVFWQFALGAALLGGIHLATGRRFRWDRTAVFWYAVIALTGTFLPNMAIFEAARVLPAGILAILGSCVPMMAYPIALAMGLERRDALRFLGLGFGFVGVMFIILPETSLPDPAMLLFLPLALIGPFFDALEGNLVARFGADGLDPVQLLFGAACVGTVLSLPVALFTGTFIAPLPPYGLPDLAILCSSALHVAAYCGYFWLVTQSGAIFAAQVGYLITLFGVLWARVLLGESYAMTVWLALALMLVGVFFVQPRPSRA